RQFRIDADHRIMGLVVFVLILGRQRHASRNQRDGSEDRPVLSKPADLAVVLHDLREFRLDLAAIGALIIKPLDDRDIAIGISGSPSTAASFGSAPLPCAKAMRGAAPSIAAPPSQPSM